MGTDAAQQERFGRSDRRVLALLHHSDAAPSVVSLSAPQLGWRQLPVGDDSQLAPAVLDLTGVSLPVRT